MITPPPGVQVYLACGYTDMRKGMATLAMLVQQTLGHDPFSGAIYAFRGRRGGLIKVLWHDGVGMCLFIKRLCQDIWTYVVYRSVGTSGIRCIRSARVRTPGSRDGRSDSYSGVGYPMMTVRRRAAPLWPRT